MEIGKLYDVIFAELMDGSFESEKMELIRILAYKDKNIYVFIDSYGSEFVTYDHKNKNIDWDFMNEINDKFRER